jgi:hypothetical protein
MDNPEKLGTTGTQDTDTQLKKHNTKTMSNTYPTIK